jgi:hypothetical protein
VLTSSPHRLGILGNGLCGKAAIMHAADLSIEGRKFRALDTSQRTAAAIAWGQTLAQDLRSSAGASYWQNANQTWQLVMDGNGNVIMDRDTLAAELESPTTTVGPEAMHFIGHGLNFNFSIIQCGMDESGHVSISVHDPFVPVAGRHTIVLYARTNEGQGHYELPIVKGCPFSFSPNAPFLRFLQALATQLATRLGEHSWRYSTSRPACCRETRACCLQCFEQQRDKYHCWKALGACGLSFSKIDALSWQILFAIFLFLLLFFFVAFSF